MEITSGTSKMLSKEHENILKVVDALETELKQVEDGTINKAFFKEVIDFVKNYADKFHHAKEEDILFKEFDKCVKEGSVNCNPIRQMIFEHITGREEIKIMEVGVRTKNKEDILAGARGYIQLIREHITKEDTVLYPMADEAMSDEVKASMLEKFKQVNTDKQEDVERFEAFIEEVKKKQK
ncbi:MAG: hypothetical protein GOV00_04300 [Candidatus Altiarchaeota archaeon]|nr:hypothetical protein [Candidatus Altiarchaeota archaeon]